MNPIIPIWMIYFSGVCDNIKYTFLTFGIIIIIIAWICIMCYCMANEQWGAFCKKCVTCSIVGCGIVVASMFIPNQKTMYTMMIGSQITPSNIELVGGTVKTTVDYMFDKTGELIKTVKGTEESK
jgi:uncharacterized membrane protein